MKINQDFKRVWRAGYCMDKHTYRNHQESAWHVFFAIILAIALIFVAAIASADVARIFP